ncbi:hypothetical protein MMC13_003806 [Lambiella insularis]|nr:hypothetical protein [Lambiella insularis]
MADSSNPSSEAPRPASPKPASPEGSTPHVTPIIADSSDPEIADESTPLLASETGGASSTVPPRSRTTYVLTILSLVFSLSTLVFLGVAGLILRIAAPTYYSWNYEFFEALPAVITLAILSFFISAFNVTRLRANRPTAPLGLSLILDLIISFYVVSSGVMGLSAIVNRYDYDCHYRNGSPSEVDDCLTRVLPAKVFAAIAFGTAIALGVDHLVLFVMRCRAVYLTKFWKRPWHFPTGQFTVEFTVKLLRQTQEGTER